jgi:hypothetical protein
MILSGEYAGMEETTGVIADAVLRKGEYDIPELLGRLQELGEREPDHPRPRPALAPVWVPRTRRSHALVTCPACLKSFELRLAGRMAGPQQATCGECHHIVNFVLQEQWVRAAEEGVA